MPADRILPGLVTPAAADLLGASAAQTEENRRAIERMLEEDVWEFPAKVTGYDSATGRCSWRRQAYSIAGRRVDDTENVTGDATYAPAYPVGNGVMPPPGLGNNSGSGTGVPVEVWMRLRVVTGDLGPVFEFDWQCACDGGYSGSGGV
jgi:hypothetical protein